MITSSSNKKVKEVILLNQKSKERQKQGVFVTEGIKMFLEAPENMLTQVYLSEDLDLSEKPEAAEKLAYVKSQKPEIIVETVQADVFRKMSDTMTPQGILCIVRKPEYKLDELLKAEGVYLLLENVQDPGNLGTMFRTAEGAGVDGIIMTKETVDLFNPKTIRSTMGSIFRVPYMYTDDILQVIDNMHSKGICTFAAHLKGEKYYDELDFSGGTAFLIGNEGNGLSDTLAQAAKTYLKIPMDGQLESLNAAVAAAILMYESKRQRRKKMQ